MWNLSSSLIFSKSTGLYVAMAGCKSELIYDSCSFAPGAHTCAGVGNYSHFRFDLENDGALRSRYDGSCVTRNSDDTLSALPCKSPLGTAQKWSHTAAGQLQVGSDCMTASGASPTRGGNITAVFGRPLSSAASPHAGAYAVLLLNDGEGTEVECDADCVSAMDLPAAFPDTAFARDLWSHTALAPIDNLRKGFRMAVEAGGASRLLKLCATQAECASRASVPAMQ